MVSRFRSADPAGCSCGQNSCRGLDYGAKHAVVATDGMITDGPYPESKELIGGVFVVDVPTWEAAPEWAAKVAVACRCAQDVREFSPFRRPDLER